MISQLLGTQVVPDGFKNTSSTLSVQAVVVGGVLLRAFVNGPNGLTMVQSADLHLVTAMEKVLEVGLFTKLDAATHVRV